MLRKLAIAIAASGAMISASNIHALGMGEIELESALNQPLDARIKLLKADELENWEIKPDLASAEAFEKSGVDRIFFLNSIKFEVERIGPDVFVNITSQQPVVEPFLNFLVRVDWPNGRLLREYTLLLDPPVFTEEPMAPVQAPEAEYEAMDEPQENLPGMAPAPASQQASAYQEPEPVQKPAPVAKPQVKKEKTYKVRANDTLWEVAIRTRENRRITPQQAMLAIQDLNPDAFINGNINRLKKNQVLRVPTKEQMLSRSFNEAVAEVAMQNDMIAKRKAKKAQLDATRKEFVNERDDKVDESRLKLLAGGEATTDSERGASGQVAAEAAGDQSKLDKELSLAFENLDKSQRENQELRTRLDALEDQINTLQRLINLKDQQMVALQAGVAQRDEQKADSKPAQEPAKPKEMVELEAAPEQVLEADDAAAKKAADDGMGVKAKQDLNFADGSEKAPKQTDSVKKQIAPAPMPVEEPFDPVAFVIENPPVIGGALGALLLALLGVNFARKKKEQQLAQAQENTALEAGDPLAEADLDLDANLDDEFSDLDMGDSEEVASAEFDGADGSLGDSIEDSSADNADVIAEADGYLAYGRAEAARDVLASAIESQPGRLDVRVKMVEVLSQMTDQAQMAEHVEFVMANGSEQEQAQVQAFASGDSLSADLMTDGFDDLDLGDAGTTENDFEGLELGEDSLGEAALDESFDLDLETADLELGGDDLTLDSEMESSDLDFDLDGLELNEPETLDVASDGGDLEFDLELDGDSDLGELSSADQVSGDDMSLDFELGEDDLDSGSNELSLDGLENDELSLDFESPVSDGSEAGLEFDLDSGTDELSLDSDEGLELGALDSDDNSLEFTGLDSDDEVLDLSVDSELDLDADLDSLELDNGLQVEEDSGLADLELELDESPELELDSELATDSVSDLEGELTDLGDAVSELDLEDSLELDSLELDAADDLADLSDVALEDDSSELETLELDTGSDLELDSAFDELPELDADDAIVLEVDDELPTLDDMQDLTDLELAADEELANLDEDIAGLDDDLSDLSTSADLESSADTVEISLSEGDELPTLEEFEVTDDSSDELPELSELSDDADLDLDTDLDFLSGTDESETKLDLARAYIDMDDKDGAREILQEVLEEGSDKQKQEANQLLDGLA